ncbi:MULTISPECIES: T9SS type A sorting domain-containing protein [Empedobacter]|uniref:T9SS type A sorting domain-containing protein n=1 Tax=Empedobacter falsenii TaxID=343874 RepID=A0A7H9DS41_9FLAO|nr:MULTISPECIES: T9SS type A sorting domain-containing protein [Empedobacter]MBY0066927.1 T9SS type A sorting domain-containing protein [Empedobacter falsenii]MDH0659474.1 T9SS type A sorting domain-containing protein [Empedobacter sp. GD03865]MDH2208622.1 T9SS type A sorting domain-containing protein [Empedobacter sp. GD03644]MDM1042900.1 T9SS type A sorting domain-containing protein [Empedobacter brevis]MDM1136814.1 T9SS type A sorting domain-containing protein [Empedobacter sp. R750]
MKKFYSLVAVAALSTLSFAQVNAIPGSDFEDWAKFTTGVNKFGLKSYAVQGVGKGVNGSNSLNITTTPTANDYVFTSLLGGTVSTQPKEITFWVKGTSGKTLSLNVYKSDGGYYAYNVGDLSSDSKISSSASNQYTGVIDTKGNWVKVTLDLSDKKDLNVADLTKDFFALKVGKDAAYALDIDNIQLWDVNMNVYDLTSTKAVSNTLWTNTASFNVKDKTIVEVYNINGQLVKSFEVKGVQNVDVSSLVKGTYVVKTTSNGKSSTQKVVKK